LKHLFGDTKENYNNISHDSIFRKHVSKGSLLNTTQEFYKLRVLDELCYNRYVKTTFYERCSIFPGKNILSTDDKI
jgi:hypothetical protein